MDVSTIGINTELGLVFGFAIVCSENDVPYYDLQNEHIPDDVMLKSACEFMLNSRAVLEMHKGEVVGQVVFAFPMTREIADAMDISTSKTGLMIAMRPSDAVLQKFKSGELKGFSVGGSKQRTVVNDNA